MCVVLVLQHDANITPNWDERNNTETATILVLFSFKKSTRK